jgi:hypothetical protein
MDLDRLTTIARSIATVGSRRRLLGALVSASVLGRVLDLLNQEDVVAKDRRRRRKRRHRRRKNPGSRKRACHPKSKATVCAGRCGKVTSRRTCGKTVDCGSCDCPTPCGECLLCQSGPNTPGACVPDPEQVGDPCGSDGQICGADGTCACDAGSCSNPTPICDDGVCVACSDSKPCISGCCNLVTGACVTECPVQYCHSITATSGACPTAATQFCQDEPILATSSDHALRACEACFGEGSCTLDISCLVCGCGAWERSFTFFSFAETTCCPSLPGDITDVLCTKVGRWAP